jgi:hypothetical protein
MEVGLVTEGDAGYAARTEAFLDALRLRRDASVQVQGLMDLIESLS